jgi:polysaccharide chain length determinant protein (PEP-CTERM system associated)
VLPGKKLNLLEVLKASRHRPVAIVAPFLAIFIGTVLVSMTIPDRFRSQAQILVAPQTVPENYVRSTVSARLEQRLHSVSQQILSHETLDGIIREFNLYPERRSVESTGDLVARMRRDIVIGITRVAPRREDGGTAFTVSYTAPDPQLAMQVTERLVRLFIDQNFREREDLAKAANQFLETQLAEAQSQLTAQEARLKQYRTRYAVELPGQFQYNLGHIDRLRGQLQAHEEARNRNRARRQAIEQAIAEAGDRPADAMVAAPVIATPPPAPGRAAAELELAQAELNAMALQLKPEHPDLIRQTRKVRDLEQKAAAEAAQVVEPGTDAPVTALPAAGGARRVRLAQMQAELAALDHALAASERESAKITAQVAELERRVQGAPVRETELATITREYNTALERYNSLLTKSQDSKVAVNLEQNRIGEQFRVIEPAQLPNRPFYPDRGRISLLGALAGLGLGIVLAAVLEFRNQTLRNEEEVRMTLNLPVLAMIPLIAVAGERRSPRRFLLGSSWIVVAVVLVWTLVS